MKGYLVTILLFVSNLVVFAQQDKFLDISKINKSENGGYNSVYIGPEQEVDLGEVPAGAESLTISIPLDPESSDDEKEKYVQHILNEIEKIAQINNHYQIITIEVGEQIFLSRDEVKNIYKSSKNYDKLAKLNMERAWNQLGLKIAQKFPSAKIYGFNFGW